MVKQAITRISALYFLSLRFTLASLCLLILFLPAFRRLPAVKLVAGLRAGFITGLFLWTGYVFQTFGLHYTSAGNSGFLTGLYIVLVPIIGAVFYRQRPSAREVVGLVLAFAGMVIMTLPASGTAFSINFGDILTIAAAVAFAFHLLILGYFSKRESVEAVALGQIACAALLSTLSLTVERPVAAWSGAVITAIVLTAVFATALAFAVQTWGQKTHHGHPHGPHFCIGTCFRPHHRLRFWRAPALAECIRRIAHSHRHSGSGNEVWQNN